MVPTVWKRRYKNGDFHAEVTFLCSAVRSGSQRLNTVVRKLRQEKITTATSAASRRNLHGYSVHTCYLCVVCFALFFLHREFIAWPVLLFIAVCGNVVVLQLLPVQSGNTLSYIQKICVVVEAKHSQLKNGANKRRGRCS